VGYAQGFTRADAVDKALTEQAVALAKQTDTVLLYMGLPEISETEGLDREHMRLPDNQVQLLKAVAAANPNVVVVLAAGSPVETPGWSTARPWSTPACAGRRALPPPCGSSPGRCARAAV